MDWVHLTNEKHKWRWIKCEECPTSRMILLLGRLFCLAGRLVDQLSRIHQNEHVVSMRETSNACGILMDKPIRGRPLGRPRIKDNIWEMKCDEVRRLELTHDHAQRQISVTVLFQLQASVSSPSLIHVGDCHLKMEVFKYWFLPITAHT